MSDSQTITDCGKNAVTLFRKAMSLENVTYRGGEASPLSRRLIEDHYAVYAVGPEAGSPLKIGISHALPTRLIDLQIGNWVRLRCHGAIIVCGRASARSIERTVHAALDQFAIDGEWFAVTVPQFEAALQKEIRCWLNSPWLRLRRHPKWPDVICL